jgi:hypothetical protein
MHLRGNRFVGRMKIDDQYQVIAIQSTTNNVLEDQTIRLTSQKGKNRPIPLRRIRFIRQEDENKTFLRHH